MATVAGPLKDDLGASQPPEPVSALRSSQSVKKRLPTRVSIVVPKTSADTDAPNPDEPSNTAATPSSARHSLSVTSTPWAKKLILTLDGGGIRGYSSLIILRALMNQIAEIERTLEPKATSSAHTDRIPVDQIPPEVYREGQYLPCHYFDYIAGTSVGGVIGIMLVMMGKSVDECIAEFRGQKKAIPFADSIPSLPAELPSADRRSTWPTNRTRSFFDTFAQFSVSSTSKGRDQSSSTSPVSPTTPATANSPGISRRGSNASGSGSSSSGEFKKDTFQCQAIAWCAEVKGDTHGPNKKSKPAEPYAFCSYKEEDEDEEEVVQPANTRARTNSTASSSKSIISIPEVAKAITTPCSSSFKPFRLGNGHFVDGSKLIRDPTLSVIKEISSLLSPLSTDDEETNEDEEDEDSVSPAANPKTQTIKHDPPIDLLLSLGTDEHQAWFYEKLRRPAIEKNKSQLREQQGISYRTYHRFEVPNLRLPLLRKKLILSQIEQTTENYLAQPEVQEQIRKYAALLVEKRRERAQTSRWESFALGVKYFCHHAKVDEDGNVTGCKSVRATQGFESRGDYYEHLEKSHKLSKMAMGSMRKKGRGSSRKGSVKAKEFDVEAELDKGRRFGCN